MEKKCSCITPEDSKYGLASDNFIIHYLFVLNLWGSPPRLLQYLLINSGVKAHMKIRRLFSFKCCNPCFSAASSIRYLPCCTAYNGQEKIFSLQMKQVQYASLIPGPKRLDQYSPYQSLLYLLPLRFANVISTFLYLELSINRS